jgi:hypothetical protein
VFFLALVQAGARVPLSAQAPSFLATTRRHVLLASTVPDNGDLNPYAIVVAPVTAGKLVQGDVLVDNFNSFTNYQGTGTTIVQYRPDTRTTTLFAQVPGQLPGCPGGVGLSTAMTMLRTGWIIVGSAPSTMGTTATKGTGALLVLDAEGKLVSVWKGAQIDAPWGNIAMVDNGDTATLFITMAGAGLQDPKLIDPNTGIPPVLHHGTVLRLELEIPAARPPILKRQTVIGDGFSQRADLDKFLLGPTGLALGPDNTLYVADGVENTIHAIPDALARGTSAGTGRVVSQGGLLKRPLAMAMTPEGHLLVCNGLNGMVVEIEPLSGKQLASQWLDSNQAQTPPGNGDLFGIAMAPGGQGFYYVQDETSTLMFAGK